MTGYSAPAALARDDLLDGFRCGAPSLDDWLVSRAWDNEVAGFSRTYVTTDHERVVGYHALSGFSLPRECVPGRARRQAPTEIPAVLLGRLAVDREHQGRGIGAVLLRHAMALTDSVSEAIGVRVLVVNALDEAAAAFYEQYGFEQSPINPHDLMLTVPDLRATW